MASSHAVGFDLVVGIECGKGLLTCSSLGHAVGIDSTDGGHCC